MNTELGTGLGTYIPLVVYLMGMTAAFLSLFRKPHWALWYLVLVLPLQTTRDRIIPFPLGAQMIEVLWFSSLLGLLFGQGTSFIAKSSLNKWFITLAIITYISLWRGFFYLDSEMPLWLSNRRFSDWTNYMMMPIICIVAAGTIKKIQDIKTLIVLMSFTFLLVNWSFFRSSAGRDFSHYSNEIRDAGVIGYAGANGFAAFVAMLMVFLITLYFFIRGTKWKLAIAGLLAFSGYCLLFSFSRGAYFACLLGITFIAMFRQKKLLIAVAVILFSWQVVLPTAVKERIDMTYDKGDQSLEASAADRVLLWQDAMTLVRENLVFGTGIYTYHYMHRIGRYEDTHNYYVKVLVEMGPIGLLLLLAILFQMWHAGFRLYRTSDDSFVQGLGLGFAALVLCIAVANFFGDRWSYLQVDGYLWILLGCVIRAQVFTGEDKKPEVSEADANSVSPEYGEFVAVN
jgi:putative inorganic carbon (HCO3(-)) transporter